MRLVRVLTESFQKFTLAHKSAALSTDFYCPLLIEGVFMLTCSSDQECTLRMNLLIVHTSYAKWPQSTYTVLFSENMNPKDVPQEPAVLQVLKSLQHHNSAPLK